MTACTRPPPTEKLTPSTAQTPAKRLVRSRTSSSASAVTIRAAPASVGTSPRGIAIMVTTRISPNAAVSAPSNRLRSWGSTVSTAAPTTDPASDAIPPTTTIVSSSTEVRKLATWGVTKPT